MDSRGNFRRGSWRNVTYDLSRFEPKNLKMNVWGVAFFHARKDLKGNEHSPSLVFLFSLRLIDECCQLRIFPSAHQLDYHHLTRMSTANSMHMGGRGFYRWRGVKHFHRNDLDTIMISPVENTRVSLEMALKARTKSHHFKLLNVLWWCEVWPTLRQMLGNSRLFPICLRGRPRGGEFEGRTHNRLQAICDRCTFSIPSFLLLGSFICASFYPTWEIKTRPFSIRIHTRLEFVQVVIYFIFKLTSK